MFIEMSSSVVMNSLRRSNVRISSSFMLTKHHAKFVLDQTSNSISSVCSSTNTKCPQVLLSVRSLRCQGKQVKQVKCQKSEVRQSQDSI